MTPVSVNRRTIASVFGVFAGQRVCPVSDTHYDIHYRQTLAPSQCFNRTSHQTVQKNGNDRRFDAHHNNPENKRRQSGTFKMINETEAMRKASGRLIWLITLNPSPVKSFQVRLRIQGSNSRTIPTNGQHGRGDARLIARLLNHQVIKNNPAD